MRALSYACVAAGLALGGCRDANTVQRSEFDQLKFEVAALKSEVSTLSTEREALAAKERAQQIEPPKPVMTYQLIGSSFKDEQTFKYPTRQRCEEARATLIETWAEEDARNRERGVIYTSRPTPTCLPL